jgi:DNA-binding LacI/PurR family transcriptional regulator
MSQGTTSIVNVKQLVQMIEHDLKNRGLSEGQPYLTADELGRQFSAHPRSVSRAMHVLAKRGVVVRKRGVGTFVGRKLIASATARRVSVSLLISAERMRMGLLTGELIEGIVESAGSDQVHLNLLPETADVAYVQRLLDETRESDDRHGFVLIGCRREIQEAVAASHLPTVVFGGVFPGTASLPSVDVDQRELGCQLARYLIDRGRDRMALFTRELWLPGDNLYHDGIRQARNESPGQRADMVLRSIAPSSKEVAAGVIAEVLRGEERPNGIICRGPFFAEAAVLAAERVGLNVPDDVEIVFDHASRISEIGLPHAYPVLSYKEQAKVVGRTLTDLVAGRPVDTLRKVLPVRGIEA